jgi:hypothetical protein
VALQDTPRFRRVSNVSGFEFEHGPAARVGQPVRIG